MVDIIIIAVLVLTTIFGYRRGFFKSLTGIVSVIVSFVIEAYFLKTTVVYEVIYENIEKNMAASNSSDISENESEEFSIIPEKLIKGVEKSTLEIRDGVLLSVSEKIADLAVKMLSMVMLFLVSRIVVGIIIALLGFVKKLPLFGWFDSLLGAVLGFVRGFFVVYIILLIVAFASSFNPENVFAKNINQSEFAKVMYYNNVFFNFINKD